jgi:predicted nuclease of predicted toxin-antitoxin system
LFAGGNRSVEDLLASVELGAVIVSKDADYLAWPNGLPVQLVSIRIGNVGNAQLILTLDAQWAGVVERLRGGEQIVRVF